MATTTTKKIRVFYTVQEITTAIWSEPVGGNRVWSLQQAKRIRRILRKQRRECFLAPIRIYA